MEPLVANCNLYHYITYGCLDLKYSTIRWKYDKYFSKMWLLIVANSEKLMMIMISYFQYNEYYIRYFNAV